MANPEQLEYLQDTAEEWNIYRQEHAITHPNLSGANLTGADLTGADVTGANLARVDLSKAVLTGVVGLPFNGT
ncbi:MAG TPA: pentapeptide repeat-containing protein [Ktedonobacteraceae bacterium]|jgi:uncharacterized protein YjbI with pentapeptide repeats|nr:pentapeptide repeat-containing protein [Ktedonobacteraceae bacterium]